MRLGWSPSTRAGMLGTPGAMLPSSRAAVRPSRPTPPVADDPEHGGGRGLGGAPAPSLDRPPESVALFLWGRSSACTDLAGRAARRLSQDTSVVDTGIRFFANVVSFDKPAAPERIRHTPHLHTSSSEIQPAEQNR